MYDYNKDRTRLVSKKMNLLDKLIAGFLTILDQKILAIFIANTKPKISPRLKSTLFKIYESDINSLSKFLNRDLSSWSP